MGRRGYEVVSGYRKPLGYQQILTAGLVTAATLTVPAQTKATNGQPTAYAVIQNNGTASIRWRDDGTAPTTTIGMVLPAGSELDYTGDISLIQFIQVSSGAELDITYYD
jgi:hypothetical protein